MAKATRATRMLDRAGAAYTLHDYAYDPLADRAGLQAAEALGADPACVLKTLMARVDGRPVCAILASDREVAMKKLAVACGGKHAEMMTPADAERISGYRVGGISPFGQARQLPVVIDAAALAQTRVYLNGGQRGLQVQLAPSEAVRLLGPATVIEIASDH